MAEIQLSRTFMREHGAKKKQLKMSWNEYISKLKKLQKEDKKEKRA